MTGEELRDFWSIDALMVSAISRRRWPGIGSMPWLLQTVRWSTRQRIANGSYYRCTTSWMTFRSVFVSNMTVTVDESLWDFKERHHALQYNPSKCARRGLKVYNPRWTDGLEVGGYTAAFKVYMGQKRPQRVFPPGSLPLSVGHRECSVFNGWTSVRWRFFRPPTPARSSPCLPTAEG